MRSSILSQRAWLLSSGIVICIAIGLSVPLIQPSFLLTILMAYSLALVIFWLKQDWAIYALLLGSLCTAITIETGRFTLRPDQLVAITIAPSMGLMLLAGRRPVGSNLDWLILAYLFCNIFSSFLNAPDRATSLQKCMLLAVTFLAYFLTTQLLVHRKNLINVIRLFVAVGVLEAIYGIISVILFTYGIDLGGAEAQYGDLYARGTFLEGNIFGSFQMMIALLLLAFLFGKHFLESKGLILLSLLVVLVALLMSFTRAAWIGFAVGVFSYILFLRRHWLQRFLYHLPLILASCLFLVAIGYAVSANLQIGSSTLLNSYTHKLKNLLEYESGTGSLRLRVWVQSVRFWTLNPVLGNGTDSIKALAVGTSMPKFGDDYWIPNSLLLALHDTGLIGFLLFCAIQIIFLWNLRRAIRVTSNPFFQTVLEGFFVAFIAVQFTYLFTNAFWLIFIWVFMGIGMMCAKHAMKEQASIGPE